MPKLFKIKCPKCGLVYTSTIDYKPIHLQLCSYENGSSNCWGALRSILIATGNSDWGFPLEEISPRIEKVFREYMGFAYWVKEVREKHEVLPDS